MPSLPKIDFGLQRTARRIGKIIEPLSPCEDGRIENNKCLEIKPIRSRGFDEPSLPSGGQNEPNKPGEWEWVNDLLLFSAVMAILLILGALRMTWDRYQKRRIIKDTVRIEIEEEVESTAPEEIKLIKIDEYKEQRLLQPGTKLDVDECESLLRDEKVYL